MELLGLRIMGAGSLTLFQFLEFSMAELVLVGVRKFNGTIVHKLKRSTNL